MAEWRKILADKITGRLWGKYIYEPEAGRGPREEPFYPGFQSIIEEILENAAIPDPAAVEGLVGILKAFADTYPCDCDYKDPTVRSCLCCQAAAALKKWEGK